MTEENIEENPEEECGPCKVAVAVGMVLDVCNRLDGKEKCEKLYQKVIKEEISPDELFKEVRKRAEEKGDKEEVEALDYIVELVREGEDVEEKTE